MIGRTISHYKILAKLGEGGMGVVYKAEDTKLERAVALKFLAAHLLGDSEAKTRFLREAKSAAALDHPNICTVYEVDEVEGKTFLAMALIEGESLDARIEKGPLPLGDALAIGRQVAEGLQAAHAKGIVHRDIKPANIMVSSEGRATVMDFGLARLTEASRLTKADTTVGTAAYMSPEQAQGREVDHRTDVWALGCVIYEMVAGARPFKGEYNQALLYEIVHQVPEPLTAVRAGLPMELEFIVGKCLAKDPAQRYQHADELAVDLESLRDKLRSGKSTLQTAAASAQAAIQPQAPLKGSLATGVRPQLYTQYPEVLSGELVPKRKVRFQQILFAVVFAATVVTLLAVSFVDFRDSTTGIPVRRFAFTLPEPMAGLGFDRIAAISPDGRHIAVTPGGQDGKLWVQDLDQQQPRVIEGTGGAFMPFWSPDSQFIAFGTWQGALEKVSVRGGPVARVCELPAGADFFGGAWSPDGEIIVFSARPWALYEVPARGGASALLISPQGSDGPPSDGPTGALVQPHFLPPEAGSRVLAFSFGNPSEQTMMIQDLETGRRQVVGEGYLPFYSPSGHLVYQSAPNTHDLWALPFSLETRQATGEAFPVAQRSRGPTAAADGTLVYLDTNLSGKEQLVWLDRRGKKTGQVGREQESMVDAAISPDGRRVAVSARENGNQDIWVYDTARDARARLTVAQRVEYRTVWSPTGEEVAFAFNPGMDSKISLRRADGGGEVKAITQRAGGEWVSDWSRDGRYILHEFFDPERDRDRADLWYLERKEEGSGWDPRPFLQTPFIERCAKLSPDGRFVAYSSNESGQYEIYVQPFPEGGRKTTVSSNGGEQARWSRDGKELFYVENRATLVAVSVSTEPEFAVGRATRLFDHPSLARSWYPQYDVSPDGQSFLVPQPVETGVEPMIRVVQNWYEEFRGRGRE